MTDNLISALNMNRIKKDELEYKLLEDGEGSNEAAAPAAQADFNKVLAGEREVSEQEELAAQTEQEEPAEIEERQGLVEEEDSKPEAGSLEMEDEAKVEEKEEEIYLKKDGSIDYEKLVYKTKHMTIDSIYSAMNLNEKPGNSVFMIERYAATLPEGLPDEIKRQSVLSILKVSDLNVDELLQDGFNRIDVLNEVLEDITQKTEDMDREDLEEIEELSSMIEELREKVARRAGYQERQNSSLASEIERIVGIVEFISPS